MRRRDDDSWDDDEDADDEDDGFDDDESETIPCPYCHRQIHEDAQRCPYCEEFISQEDAPATRKPWWIVVTAIVCLYLVYRWFVR